MLPVIEHIPLRVRKLLSNMQELPRNIPESFRESHDLGLQGCGEQARSEVLADDEDNYGIYRAEANKTTGVGWRVFLKRQGCRISRAFQDSVYGSPEASQAQARAYRDAVISAVPLRTNHEQAVRLKKSNRSGISGVRYAEYHKGPFWMAMIETQNGRKSKHFSVNKYGHDEAKKLAISQRQAWLNDLPVAYLTTTKHADTAALKHVAVQIDPTPDAFSYENLSEAEVKARLASIDAHFDSLRPPRLFVRVRCYKMSDLAVYVSDVGRPARNKAILVGMRRQSLETALSKALPKIEAAITEFYNADVARWFMKRQGNHSLELAHFDPDTGFSVLLFIPVDLIPEKRGQ